jgi:hypothetical protein
MLRNLGLSEPKTTMARTTDARIVNSRIWKRRLDFAAIVKI